MSSDSIVTSRRRVEIQSTNEMSPYFTMTKCNKLFITYLTRSTERLPSLPSSILTISPISIACNIRCVISADISRYASLNNVQ